MFLVMPTPCHVTLSSRTSGGSQLLGESLNSPTWNPMLITLVCLCLQSLPLYFSSFHACIPGPPRSLQCYSIQPYALFVGSFRFRWIPSTLKTWPKFCLPWEALPPHPSDLNPLESNWLLLHHPTVHQTPGSCSELCDSGPSSKFSMESPVSSSVKQAP